MSVTVAPRRWKNRSSDARDPGTTSAIARGDDGRQREARTRRRRCGGPGECALHRPKTAGWYVEVRRGVAEPAEPESRHQLLPQPGERPMRPSTSRSAGADLAAVSSSGKLEAYWQV
jgi:hypothetical protein